MKLEKEIVYRNRKIGSAKISTEGLYYRFECRCRFREPGIYRLFAFCNEKKAYLGICVPEEDAFGITTKIPVNRLGTGDIEFVAESEEAGKVLPVDQDKPFLGIEKLDDAVLCVGGIRIKS